MAAAPIIGTAVGAVSSVSGILGKSKQAAAQEAQIQAQRVGLRDQATLNEASIAEQRRQVNAAAMREQLLGLQAQTLGMVQNDMQAKQQDIAGIQATIQNDQASFLNMQRSAQKEAVANIAATEQLKQLQQISDKGAATTTKIGDEAAGITAQRLQSQGAGSMDTQSGDVLLERVMNALAESGVSTQSLFSGEMDDQAKQLLYETVTAGLEEKLGGVATNQNAKNISAGSTLNELQRLANAQNINTQTARNTNALDYETASKRGNLNLQSASNTAQTGSQMASLKAQSSAISKPGFADFLGAGANLGMSLYQSGIFGKGGASSSTPNPQPYSIMQGGAYNVTPFSGGTASGLLSGAGSNAFGFSTGKMY